MANQNNQNNPNQYGTDSQRQKDAGHQSNDKNQSLRPEHRDKNDRSGQRDDKDMRKDRQH